MTDTFDARALSPADYEIAKASFIAEAARSTSSSADAPAAAVVEKFDARTLSAEDYAAAKARFLKEVKQRSARTSWLARS